jgi:hypothetical protein
VVAAAVADASVELWRRKSVVGSLLAVRSGRAEALMWWSCCTLDGVVEANVRVEEVRKEAKAVVALRMIALDGAMVDMCVAVVMDGLKVWWLRQRVVLVMDVMSRLLVS